MAARIEKGDIADLDKHVYFDEKRAKSRVNRLQNLEDESARIDREGGHERPSKTPWQVVRVFGYVKAVIHD